MGYAKLRGTAADRVQQAYGRLIQQKRDERQRMAELAQLPVPIANLLASPFEPNKLSLAILVGIHLEIADATPMDDLPDFIPLLDEPEQLRIVHDPAKADFQQVPFQ